MKNKIKWRDVLIFIVILGGYFLPNLFFKTDKAFYDSLIKINVPSYIYAIAWTIIYILMAVFITWTLKDQDYKSYKTLWIYVVLNYLIQASFVGVFFENKNLFLGYIIAIATLVTTLLIAFESYSINKKRTLLLLPYLAWGVFASIQAVYIYLMN